MHSNLIRLSVFVASLLALGACSTPTAPPLEGTYSGTSVTPLPSPPLPPGDLEIDATLRLDAATSLFELDMDLSALMLEDVMDVRGSYVAANGVLTLTPTGFDTTRAPGNTPSVVEGVHCITLQGFAGTVACIPMQAPEYAVAGDELTFTLSHNIAGEDGSTSMMLTRVP